MRTLSDLQRVRYFAGRCPDLGERVRLVRELLDPPALTPEMLDQLRAESKAWRKAFSEKVKGMEVPL